MAPRSSPANDTRSKVDPDPRVARALAAMRQDLSRRFTVASLAKIAGMSRAAFARRFLVEVGEPPLRHLAALRLAQGALLLVERGASIAEVAAVVGYVSEFAFARAFKRRFGKAPGAFRRASRQGVVASRAAA